VTEINVEDDRRVRRVFPDPRRIAARCASAYSRLCTGMEHEVQQVGVVGIAEERLGMSPEKINIKMPEYGQLIVPRRSSP
jgi:hypothetical protein